MILDSGNRTEFSTGAVRDVQEGKGRTDLLPLRVVSNLLGEDVIIENVDEFLKNNNTKYLYKALKLFVACAYESDIFTMILEVSKHFEEGAKKYGEHNWQKGIPVNRYIDSALRHYVKYLRGDEDEPHDRAFVWNLMCCIWEVDHHKPEEKSFRDILPVRKIDDRSCMNCRYQQVNHAPCGNCYYYSNWDPIG